MRTKSLILTVAVGVAATAAAMAQNNVYSVNAVGYVNKVLTPGFNLIANPLNAGSNTVANVFPSVPEGSRIFRYNSVSGSYSFVTYEMDDFGNLGWSNPNIVVAPGEGFFFRNGGSTNVTVTFVGEVPQGPALNNPLPAGFSLKSAIVPQQGQLDTVHNFPVAEGDRIFVYNPTAGSYQFTTWEMDDFGVLGWSNPARATVDVGQGFFVLTSAAKTWTRNFSATN